MPRPLPDGVGFLMGNGSLDERPQLVARIGIIAAIWTETDTLLAGLVANLLGVNAPDGIDLFNSVENEGAKLAMIRGMGKRLAASDQADLEKLLAKIREKRGERNAVIHGIWGISYDAPDELVWQDPRDSLEHTAEIHASFIDGEARFPREKLRLYSKKDFDDIEERGRKVREMAFRFSKSVIARYTLPAISGELKRRTQ